MSRYRSFLRLMSEYAEKGVRNTDTSDTATTASRGDATIG